MPFVVMAIHIACTNFAKIIAIIQKAEFGGRGVI